MKQAIKTTFTLLCWGLISSSVHAAEVSQGEVSFRYHSYPNRSSKAEIVNTKTQKKYPVLVAGPHEGFINFGDMPMGGIEANGPSELVALQYSNYQKLYVYVSDDKKASCRQFQLDWKPQLNAYYIEGYWYPKQQMFSLFKKVSCPVTSPTRPLPVGDNNFSQQVSRKTIVYYNPPPNYEFTYGRQGYFPNDIFKFHNYEENKAIMVSAIPVEQLKQDQQELTALGWKIKTLSIKGKSWYTASALSKESNFVHAFYLDKTLLNQNIVINILLIGKEGEAYTQAELKNILSRFSIN